MNILYIAPVPPPVTGQSLAAKVLFDELVKKYQIEVINLNKDSFKSGVSSLSRIKQILKILKDVWISQRNKNIIYFTISESFAGNMKDLLIYLICFKKRKNMIIHMLGGAGMKRILEKKGLQYKINSFFLSRLGNIIVEGKTQSDMFAKLVPQEKIHIVSNFAEDFLFVSENEIKDKFTNINPLRILFLSNLLFGKGYKELVDAYLGLNDELKEKVSIVFIGGFETDKNKSDFLKMIEGHKGLIYHGLFVSGDEKKSFYFQSHIFCLPTYYPYEGQPISILEAYATGCVVITTDHSGIPDIFTDAVNGFKVEKESAKSIRLVIEQILENPEQLLNLAITNRKIAYEKYRTSIYNAAVIRIIESVESSSKVYL